MGTKNPLVFGRPLRRNEVTLWTTRAAHSQRKSGTELVVVDEFPTTLSVGEAVVARARRLLEVRHPNLAAVRDAANEDASRLVVSEFVEGERLDELAERERPPIEVTLRIVIDVLGALSALHDLDDPIVHGHVAARNVIVGSDGSARLVRGYLGPGRLVVIEPGSKKIAPEIRDDGVVDSRADLYAVGALLDELLPPVDARPPWAGGLAEIVAKACAPEPRKRFDRAADFTRELRLLARSRVASPARVAAFVDATVGDRIAARRAELGAAGPRRLQPSLLDLTAAGPAVTRTQPMPRAKVPSTPPAPRRGPSQRRKKTPQPALLAPLPSTREPSTAYEVPVDRTRLWIFVLAILILLAGTVAWWARPLPTKTTLASATPPAESPTEPATFPVPPDPTSGSAPTVTASPRGTNGRASVPPSASASTEASTKRRPFDPSAIF